MLPKISGAVAIIPGFVNAHSHAFQRVLRGRTEHRAPDGTDNFWTWREAMYRVAQRLTPADVYDIARMAYMEMLLAGITTVAEFQYLHHAPNGSPYEDANLIANQLIRAATDVGIRIVLLRTAYERPGFNKSPNPLQSRFVFRSVDTFIHDTELLLANRTTQVGIALHSVRALKLESLVRIAEFARSRKLPIHMHVAEQPAEVEECLAEHGRRPVELLHGAGILGGDFTAVHAVHITESEAAYLALSRSVVCACPTTERNLGDGAVPADRLLQHGVRICFGTDSNAQIDPFEDVRCLEYHLRLRKLERTILSIDALYEGATQVGAQSLGLTLDESDCSRVDLSHPSLAGCDGGDPAQLLFACEKAAIRDVFVAGEQVICEGRHRDQPEITSRFQSLQKSLWP